MEIYLSGLEATLRKKHRPRQLTRTQEERQSLPALRHALGALGIQLGVAHAGVGKFSVAGDRYFVAAFGDAFVLSQPDRRPIVFWRSADVVRWVKIKRLKASLHDRRSTYDCAISFLR